MSKFSLLVCGRAGGSNPCQFVSQALAAAFHYLKSPHSQLAGRKVAVGQGPILPPTVPGWGVSCSLGMKPRGGARDTSFASCVARLGPGILEWDSPEGWGSSGPAVVSPATPKAVSSALISLEGTTTRSPRASHPHVWPHLSPSGSLDSADQKSYIILCCGVCPVCCRTFNSIPASTY